MSLEIEDFLGLTPSFIDSSDLPEDFYGITPSYINSDYLLLNSNNTYERNDNNPKVYSTGIIQSYSEYYIGLTGGSGPDYQEDDVMATDPILLNTYVTNDSVAINTGPNGSIDSRYVVNIGDGNILKGRDTSLVVGYNNTVETGSINVSIIGGSNNTMSSGLTNSVLINGVGKVVNKSDITVLDGKPILSTKPIQTIVHIIDGKLNPFNQYVPFQVVDGGKDIVRPLYSKSIITVVESDTTVFFYQK